MILYISAGLYDNKDIGIDVNSGFNRRAFGFDGKAEYSLPYDKYVGHEDDNCVLFYCYFGQKSPDSPRVVDIRCFFSTGVALNVPFVCWEFSLDGLGNIDLVQCFVNEIKKNNERRRKDARSVALEESTDHRSRDEDRGSTHHSHGQKVNYI